MGNTLDLLALGSRWHRGGVRFAKASVASLSEMDPTAMRADFAFASPSPDHPTTSALPTLAHIPGWPHPTDIGFPYLPDQQAGKMDRVFSLAHQLQSYRIPDQCFADKPFAPSPFDLPVAPHAAHRPTAWIAQRHTARWPRLRTINLGGRALSQSLVGTDFVVGLGPAIRPPLLRPWVTRSRPRRLGLHHPMHLLVPTILFWMPWRDEFHPNPLRRPPRTQARKPRWTGRTERDTVVHPNGSGVSILPEQPHKHPADLPPILHFQQTGAQQIPTEQIPHGQWLHALAILSSKPTLEIHGPDLIASPGERQSSGPQRRSHTGTSAPTAIQFHPLEPPANGPRRGSRLPWIFFAQPSPQLPAPPTPMFSAQPPDPDLPLRRHSPRRALGPSRSIAQSTTAILLEPGFPFVAQ